MSKTKEHLAAAIEGVRTGDNEAAQKAFSAYATEKTQEILHPEEVEEAPEASDASNEKVE